MSFFPTGGNVYLNEQITVTWPYSSDLGRHIYLQIWYGEGDYIENLGGTLLNTEPQGAYNWTPISYTPGQYYDLNTCNLDSTLRQDFPNPIWLTTRASSSLTSSSASTSSATSASLPDTPADSTSSTSLSPSPRLSTKEGGSTIGGAVGGAIGGVAVLATIAFTTLLIRRRRKRRLDAATGSNDKIDHEVWGYPEDKSWREERLELENSHGTSELPARPMSSVEMPAPTMWRRNA